MAVWRGVVLRHSVRRRESALGEAHIGTVRRGETSTVGRGEAATKRGGESSAEAGGIKPAHIAPELSVVRSEGGHVLVVAQLLVLRLIETKQVTYAFFRSSEKFRAGLGQQWAGNGSTDTEGPEAGDSGRNSDDGISQNIGDCSQTAFEDVTGTFDNSADDTADSFV